MRTSSSLLHTLTVSLVAFGVACSNGAAPPPLDGGSNHADTSTSVPDTGTTTSGKDGGGNGRPDASTAQSGPFASYSPAGCSYSVTPAPELGYTATAYDDSTSAGPASTATPTRVRVGLGGNVTEGQAGYPDPTTTAAFTWETGAANNAAKVQFGTSPTALRSVQAGYVWTLPATITSGPAYMHEAHVCGLAPATTYYYQVGGGAPGAELWSATQSFTTLPVPAPGTSITLGVYGDARDVVTTWQLANERMKSKNVDALLFTGDIVLTGGEESLYANWLDAIWQPNDAGPFLTLGEIMFLPVAGNHEYLFDSTAEHFSSAFAIPGTGPYAKSFGSYNIGNAHFIYIDDTAISSTTAGSTNPQVTAQLAWLNADLAAANADRTNHPFVFVYSHRGMFSTSMHATDPDVLQVRTTLAPIFAQAKVDAVFNGHDHEYERTVPIVPGNPVTGDPTAQTGGTVYVICAGVGANPYPVGEGTQSWRAVKVAFGSAGTGVNASYLGVYQTLTLSGNTAVLNAYALTSAGPDPVVDTLTLSH